MQKVKSSDLGRLIRRLDMTQKQFCEKYDFCPTHLSNVKNGKAPLTKVMAARYGLAIHQEQKEQKNS
jgi:hypothetical protein